MGAGERRKGATGERELASILREHGIDATRVSPLEAGGADFGDVREGDGKRWQVKRRKALGIYAWLEGCDRLAVRADRQPWLVVLPLKDYISLLKAGGDCGGADEKGVGRCGEGAEGGCP